jgi:hypothetical protein
MIKHISYFRKISRTFMICSCLSRAKEQKMIQCLLLRAWIVHRVPKMWLTWSDLGLTIMRGVTSHSRTQAKGCQSKDKDSQKCIPKVNTKAHITNPLDKFKLVPPIWWRECLTETTCSRTETSKSRKVAEEWAHLEGEKLDQWLLKHLEGGYIDEL